MVRRSKAGVAIVGLMGLLVACGDDGGEQTTQAGSTTTASSTGSDTTPPATSDDGTSTSGADETTSVTTSVATTEGASSTGTDELPDYSDSPCWGDVASTPVYNGVTHMLDDVAATCRAEGDRALVYVADGLWGAEVDQAAVNGLMHRLELFTPAGSVDPSQGVVRNDEDVFGPLDSSRFPAGKLEIYIVDSNGGGDGYLCGWCDYPQLHMDGVILQPLDDDYAIAIAAHETFHVIHRAQDSDETQWVDESLAEAAMSANGFFTDTDWLDSFVTEPDQNWGPGGPPLGGFNYGAALLWGTYLWERGGAPLMTAITSEPTDGWPGLDAALDAVGDDRGAFDLYLDMIVATYIDDPAAGYGFTSFEVPPVAVEGDLVVGGTEMGSLAAYGIDYFRIVDTGELTLGLTDTGAEPVVGQVVVVGPGRVDVLPLGPTTPVSVGAGQTAFVALTARDVASYSLSLD